MNILGTNAGDILVGTAESDTITGMGGDDWLRGLAGADSIAGDAGNDVLWGGDGGDSLFGGTGDDLLFGDAGDDLIDGGSGSRDTAVYARATGGVVADLATGTVTGAAGNDTLLGIENLGGSPFADLLTGSASVNSLVGGAGADTLIGAGGDDVLDGGYGRDWLQGGADDDTLMGGAGDDTLDGGEHSLGDTAQYATAPAGVRVDLASGVAHDGQGGIDTLISIENVQGGRFADVLIGNAADNVFRPGPGDDTVNGADGTDRVAYDTVSGPVTVDLQAGVTSGSAGRDTLVSIEQAQGSAFADLLIGTTGNDTLLGGAGEDTLDGGLGNDSLDGGPNDSRLGPDWASYVFAKGAVAVNLATGLASGAAGNDTMTGVEAVMGTVFADTLTGDGADNVLRGNEGNDSIDGGAGSDDAVDYADASGPVMVSLATGVSSGADGADAFTGIEGIHGSQFADVLTGDAGNNRLRGNGGNDTLNGGAGNDIADYSDATGAVMVRLDLGTAAGADGNDSLIGIENIRGSTTFGDSLRGDAGPNTIEGRGGNDVIDGGGGLDVAVFNGRFAQYRIVVEVGNFDLVVIGPEGVDRLNNIEVLKFADRVFVVQQGQDLPERLSGSDVGDLLRGRAGNDDVVGAAGDDAVYGDEGEDTLEGGTGDDFLDGGTGADTLQGGSGNDVYVVDSNGDVVQEDEATASLPNDDPDAGLHQSIGQGIDKVIASISYTLGSFLENLTLATDAGNLTGTGNTLDNEVEGNESDNILVGGGGNDTLTGGEGIDTASYGGLRDEYLLTVQDSGFKVQGPAADGVDIVDVERLHFADKGVALDIGAGAGTVAKILGAVFGADAVSNEGYAGIGLDLVDAGASYESLVQLALEARLGSGASNADVVTLLYTNVIGVAPDAGSLAYYTGLLDGGTYTRASLGVLAADSTYNTDNIDLTGLAETGLEYL